MIRMPTHCPPNQPLCLTCLAEVERRIRISRALTQSRYEHGEPSIGRDVVEIVADSTLAGLVWVIWLVVVMP